MPDRERTSRKALPQFERRAALQLQEDASSADEEAAAASRAREEFAEPYAKALDALEEDPDRVIAGHELDCARRGDGAAGLNCKVMCAIRETLLLRLGLRDAFKHVKRRENALALEVLPSVIAEIDSHAESEARMRLAMRGCFAGNLFDLGASYSADKYEGGQAGFHQTRNGLPETSRIGDFEACLSHLGMDSGGFSKAVIFVDNAGSDTILGILPFARELLKNGVKVVLAANEKPSINDITAEELASLFTRADNRPRIRDPELCSAAESGRLCIVSTGNDLPIIDLSQVSQELVEAARGCDLIVLHGMGRAIETNLNAKFTCTVLKMGVVKHPEVAACLGKSLGDCVLKYEPKVFVA